MFNQQKNKRKNVKFRISGMILCVLISQAISISAYGIARGAEKYPTKPVDIIVPYAAGAATDQLTRLLAEELSKRWGQSVNVVSKPGGNTVIGTQFVMSASPDGYTLLATDIGSGSAQMGLKGLPYDPWKRSFLAMTVTVPLVIITSIDSPWRSLKEVAEAGRKDPSSIVWGAASGGRGASDIVLLQFFEAAGIVVPKTRRVDFSGGAPSINALAGGHTKLAASSPGAVFPAVSSGKAKALGVTGLKRTALLPDVPTTKEAGFPAVDNANWNGLSGPPDLPANVKQTIARTLEEILKDPVVVERLKKMWDGAATFLGPEDFEAFVKEDAKRMDKLVKLLTP
jgi:tripartite-type tricarboxylate transporter receptor subunit TctC